MEGGSSSSNQLAHLAGTASMLAEDILPGTYSVIGRATAKKIEKLRGDIARQTPGAPAPKGPGAERFYPGSAKEQLSRALSAPAIAAATQDAQATSGGASPTMNAAARSTGASGCFGSGTHKSQNPSPCFLAPGMQSPRFCEAVMRKSTKRFIFPAKLDQKPEVGRYDPNHMLTAPHLPSWDFGEQSKTESRLPPSVNRNDPFEYQDIFSKSFSFSASCSSFTSEVGTHIEQMAVGSARPDLGKLMHLKLQEIPEHQKPWAGHDKISSKLTRVPVWDMEKHGQEHSKLLTPDTYYEPAKYPLEKAYELVDPRQKEALSFDRSLDRSVEPVGHWSPPSVLMKDDDEGGSPSRRRKAEPNPTIPDRSLFRSCAATRPFKVQSVTEFSRQTPRPPINPLKLVYHDEQDLEATASVIQKELAYDATTADRAIIPRHDYAPVMSRTLPRQRASRGLRLLEGDLTHQAFRQFRDSKTSLEGDLCAAKESPNHPRRDCGFVEMQRSIARFRSDTNGAASPLRRPRSTAAPNFARTAPLAGFAPRTVIAGARRPATMATGRTAGGAGTTHKLLATCSTDLHDEAEALPAPGAGARRLELS